MSILKFEINRSFEAGRATDGVKWVVFDIHAARAFLANPEPSGESNNNGGEQLIVYPNTVADSNGEVFHIVSSVDGERWSGWSEEQSCDVDIFIECSKETVIETLQAIVAEYDNQ